jgi:hypothetical protein
MIKPDGSNHDHDLRFGRSETENIREWPSWEILQKRRYLKLQKIEGGYDS